MIKKCSKCGKVKDTSEFYVNDLYSDGYQNICKECAKEYGRLHSKKRQLKDPNYMKKYYQKRKKARITNEQRLDKIINILEQILDKID